MSTILEPATMREGEARTVRIASGYVEIEADLVVPHQARGVVLFAHGCGSSRFSRRNRTVAVSLQQAGFATMMLDLLTPQEVSRDDYTGEFRFDIERLATRVAAATAWLADEPSTQRLPLGLFGASTGAAAALIVAGARDTHVKAVVSGGGRPDLAGTKLVAVRVPTLLLVGENDAEVMRLNRRAQLHLAGPSELSIVHGATHGFEEPGALETVTAAARSWFVHHLTPDRHVTDCNASH